MRCDRFKFKTINGMHFEEKDLKNVHLHSAVDNCDTRRTRELLDVGADVNFKLNTAIIGEKCTIRGENVLHVALKNDCKVELIILLLKFGVDINAKDLEGSTPLDIAESRENQKIRSILSIVEAKKRGTNQRLKKNVYNCCCGNKDVENIIIN